MTIEGVTKMSADGVVTPALLLDLDALERNIARMRDLVAPTPLRYRPHVKSHKTAHIARLQVAAGACGVCCSTVMEAEEMAAGGIGDILLTSPVADGEKVRRLIELAGKCRVAVVVDDTRQVDALSEAAAAGGAELGLVVEVDVGQGRCGARPGPDVAAIAQAIVRSPAATFAGLQGYNGAIQMLPGYRERERRVRESLDLLLLSREAVRSAGIEVPCLTGGGTGTLPIDLALGELNEIQPGSYVVMDSNYAVIESTGPGETAGLFEPALSVLGTVISRPARDRAVVDVGWKSLSSDGGTPCPKGAPGLTFEFAGDEHGLLRSTGRPLPELGERIELLPTHCDTTVNLYDTFACIRSGALEGAWTIAGRRKT